MANARYTIRLSDKSRDRIDSDPALFNRFRSIIESATQERCGHVSASPYTGLDSDTVKVIQQELDAFLVIDEIELSEADRDTLIAGLDMGGPSAALDSLKNCLRGRWIICCRK